MKEVLSGMIGGFFTVAIVYLIVAPSSKTTDLVKTGFSGFANTLGVAMGGKPTRVG
jgi:hypothetical protein